MFPTATSYLPSITAAQLRSPAAFPAISVAASKVASTFADRHSRRQQARAKSAVSTASVDHDETSMFDSFYYHESKPSAGLLHPCGAVQPEKFFPEAQPRDHRQEKLCPQADLTHLEDPYHQYAYYPKLVSDLTSVSRLLDRHRAQEVVTPVSDISMDACPSPKFSIVRDDAERTVIEVDVTSYRPEDVSATIQNGRILHIQGKAPRADGDDEHTSGVAMQFAKKFVLNDVDEESVTATIDDGLLTIGLPKLGRGPGRVKDIPIV